MEHKNTMAPQLFLLNFQFLLTVDYEDHRAVIFSIALNSLFFPSESQRACNNLINV